MSKNRYASLAVMAIGGNLILPGLFLDPSKITAQIGFLVAWFGILQAHFGSRRYPETQLKLPYILLDILVTIVVLYTVYQMLELYWSSIPLMVSVIAVAAAIQYATTQIALRVWTNSHGHRSTEIEGRTKHS